MKDLNDRLFTLVKGKADQWMSVYRCLVVENTAENIHHALNTLHFLHTQCHDDFNKIMDEYAALYGYAMGEFTHAYEPVEQGGEE